MDRATTLKTRWFTFGQCHAHAVDGFTYDKDVVVQITAPEPRDVMVETFGTEWSHEDPVEPTLC